MTNRRRRGVDLEQVNTNTNARAASIPDQVDLLKFPQNKFVTLRIISPVFMYSGYWVKTLKKNGDYGSFYVPSAAYDPITQVYDSTVYDPFYEYSMTERGVDNQDRLVGVREYGYCNAIIVNIEDQEPARKSKPTESERRTGYKDKESDTWTPVRVVRLSKSMMQQIQGIAQTNTVTNKAGDTKAVSIAHPRFGMTIRIKHSPDLPPASQYQILPVKRTPLTDAQKKYLTWNLDDLEGPEEEAELRASFESWAERMGVSEEEEQASSKRLGDDDGFDDDDEEDGFDEPPKRVRKSKSKAKKEETFEEDFDDEEEDDFDEEDDFEDDDGFEDDEDDDLDGFDDDDDLDGFDDEEEDFDEEDDDNDDVDDDELDDNDDLAGFDDDDDLDGFDDEEEDEVESPRKRTKKSKAAPKKSRSKRQDEEEEDDLDGFEDDDDLDGFEDDDDLDGFDDDEEEEPSPKKRRTKKSKAAPKKRVQKEEPRKVRKRPADEKSSRKPARRRSK